MNRFIIEDTPVDKSSFARYNKGRNKPQWMKGE